MASLSIPTTSTQFAEYLRDLRLTRAQIKSNVRGIKSVRQPLSVADRRAVLEKTGGRCHICGGTISGAWQADHVFAHSGGGHHAADNYLPAHALCNNYRWDYSAEEFQQILKLGVWVRTEIDRKTSLGMQVAGRFLAHEIRREARRKRR